MSPVWTKEYMNEYGLAYLKAQYANYAITMATVVGASFDMTRIFRDLLESSNGIEYMQITSSYTWMEVLNLDHHATCLWLGTDCCTLIVPVLTSTTRPQRCWISESHILRPASGLPSALAATSPPSSLLSLKGIGDDIVAGEGKSCCSYYHPALIAILLDGFLSSS
ncbi:hypothetical protein FA15DRAFT_660229 [Coprinopsis marcescibilis]|uniref:Uncharacterized protein n=1 Tax=Coprinopsis marcescibilis TaxID=230819 RepID=A0A5C3KG45_COPMA|nr:hypothetical protein FA15DRAFT_660229 [Coprinopsis marcescibilis]